MVHQFIYKLKSVKSGNPFKFVIQTSYDIIKAHGGEIKVETREGEGSEFIISCPLSESQFKKIKR